MKNQEERDKIEREAKAFAEEGVNRLNVAQNVRPFTKYKIAELILCGAANGLSSFSQKWFRYSSPDAGIPVFNLYTYMVSSLLLFIIWGAIRIRSGSSPRGGSVVGTKQTLMLGAYVSVMSVCIFLNTLFSTAAAGILPAAELYPLMQGGGLSVSMLMSHFLFSEKINIRCVIGAILTGALVGLINVPFPLGVGAGVEATVFELPDEPELLCEAFS